jgi:hypothetical protein
MPENNRPPSPAMEVKYPSMRSNLRSAVCCLADEQFHADVWAQDLATPGNGWPFDDAIEVVVDEIDIDKARSYLGIVFLDEAELMSYERLGGEILKLIGKLGKDFDYRDAAPTDGWHAVVVAAKDLCALMVANQWAEADGPSIST